MTFAFRDERGVYHPVEQFRYDKPFSILQGRWRRQSHNMKFLLDGGLLGRSSEPADVSLCDGAVIDCSGRRAGAARRGGAARALRSRSSSSTTLVMKPLQRGISDLKAGQSEVHLV